MSLRFFGFSVFQNRVLLNGIVFFGFSVFQNRVLLNVNVFFWFSCVSTSDSADVIVFFLCFNDCVFSLNELYIAAVKKRERPPF